MELYVGGRAQGKLAYVLQKKQLPASCVADGETATEEQILQARVVNHLHVFIRRQMKNGADVQAFLQRLAAEKPQRILILDEVGCGIVPMDAFERQYRDAVGRAGCYLAQQADHVERITCGIGQVLK